MAGLEACDRLRQGLARLGLLRTMPNDVLTYANPCDGQLDLSVMSLASLSTHQQVVSEAWRPVHSRAPAERAWCSTPRIS